MGAFFLFFARHGHLGLWAEDLILELMVSDEISIVSKYFASIMLWKVNP